MVDTYRSKPSNPEGEKYFCYLLFEDRALLLLRRVQLISPEGLALAPLLSHATAFIVAIRKIILLTNYYQVW